VTSALRVLCVTDASSHVHCVVPAGGLAPDHSRWVTQIAAAQKIVPNAAGNVFVPGTIVNSDVSAGPSDYLITKLSPSGRWCSSPALARRRCLCGHRRSLWQPARNRERPESTFRIRHLHSESEVNCAGPTSMRVATIRAKHGRPN
jgi:hypothetical protein